MIFRCSDLFRRLAKYNELFVKVVSLFAKAITALDESVSAALLDITISSASLAKDFCG